MEKDTYSTSHSHHHDEPHPHISPVTLYVGVFVALLALTLLTVQVSVWNLGNVGLIIALLVAGIKATLVVSYFMHLRYDTWFNTLVFLGSLLFVSLFFGFTFLDLHTRGRVSPEQDTFELKKEQAYGEQLQKQKTAIPQKPQD